MNGRFLFAFMIVLVSVHGFVSIGAHATTQTAQASTSISFTVTTTSNYPVTTGGTLSVMFDSIQLTTPPPQAYSFGVSAQTTPGNWITNLVWQFGDGSILNVPYCCQSQVSEVQYHAYAQPGSYTVMVVAFDNKGNYGNAVVSVDWITPIPEYPVYMLPLLASLVIAFLGVSSVKKRMRQ